MNVNAGSSANLATNSLAGIQTLDSIMMVFPVNTQLLLPYRFFEVDSTNVPATGVPGGHELTLEQVNSGMYAGDGVTYTLPFDYEPQADPCVFAFHADNNTSIKLQAAAVLILVK